jgi:hypothetical protein
MAVPQRCRRSAELDGKQADQLANLDEHGIESATFDIGPGSRESSRATGPP